MSRLPSLYPRNWVPTYFFMPPPPPPMHTISLSCLVGWASYEDTVNLFIPLGVPYVLLLCLSLQCPPPILFLCLLSLQCSPTLFFRLLSPQTCPQLRLWIGAGMKGAAPCSVLATILIQAISENNTWASARDCNKNNKPPSKQLLRSSVSSTKSGRPDYV